MGAGSGELISIDPGTKRGGLFGIARWSGGVLVAADALTPDRLEALVSCAPFRDGAGRVAVERMKVDSVGSARRKNPADLIRISEMAGWLVGQLVGYELSRVTWYEPGQWKGSLSKAVCHAHVSRALTLDEAEVVGAAVRRLTRQDARLDLWDAVSLGAAHLGRTPWRARAPRS